MALQKGVVEKSGWTGQVDLVCLSDIFYLKYGCFVVASEKGRGIWFAVGRWLGWCRIYDLVEG